MVEGDFNALDDGKISLEEYISGFENRAAPLFEQMVQERSIGWLNRAHWRRLTLFTALQFIRGTGHRAQFEAVSAGFAGEMDRRGIKLEEDLRITPAQAKVHALISITKSLHEYAGHFATKDPILFAAPLGSEFILGDNPVVWQNREPTGFWGNLGLACRGIELYLPISADLVLAFWCPSHGQKIADGLKKTRALVGNFKAQAVLGARPVPMPKELIQKAEEGMKAHLEPMEHSLKTGEAYMSSEENVINLNSLQVGQSERFIASKAGDFGLAAEMIAKDPEIGEGGQRMKIG